MQVAYESGGRAGKLGLQNRISEDESTEKDRKNLKKVLDKEKTRW